MTLRVAASFEHGANITAMWAALGHSHNDDGTDSFQTATPRWAGSRYWRSNAASTSEQSTHLKAGLFSGNIFWGGLAFRSLAGSGTASSVFGLHRGATAYTTDVTGTLENATYGVFYLNWISGTSYQVHQGDGTALGSPFTLDDATWYWLSWEVNSLDAGTLTFRVNDADIITALAGDYAGTASTGSYWSFLIDSGKSGWEFDDMIFGDGAGSVNNSIPTDSRIVILAPDADDSNTGFTVRFPAGPDNIFSKIAESPQDDDTSYVESGTVSDQYTVTTADLPFSPSAIRAIQTVFTARKTGTDLITVRPRIYSGAAYYNGVDLALGSDYLSQGDLWELDPATAAAWTETNVNALKVSGILV